MRGQVEINFGQKVGNESIKLDGVDISKAIVSFDLKATAGHFPYLELNIVLTEKSHIAGPMNVDVPEETATLLVQLGWLPPQFPVISPAVVHEIGAMYFEDREEARHAAWRKNEEYLP